MLLNFVFVGNSKQNNKGTDKKETLAARIERKQEERRKNKDQQNPEENTPGTKHDIAWILENPSCGLESSEKARKTG